MGATTSFKAYRCPECNAPLTVDEAATSVKCTYCGHTFVVRHSKPATPTPPPMAPPEPSHKPTSPMRWLSLTPVFIVALVAFILHRQGIWPSVGAVLGGDLSLQWDAVAPGPLLADVDGDGFEDFVGRCRKINPDELWVVAFGGSDLRSRWRVGPLGGWDARDAVRFAIAGRRVLVTDGRQTARVVDLGSGKPLGSVALSDRAVEACADPAAPRFFVVTADGEHFFIEGDTPARKEGARPAWCKKPGTFDFARRHVDSSVRAPSVRGFSSSWVLADDKRAVAIGEKHPGTAVPMLAGFAVGARAADWSRVLPTVDAATVRTGAVDTAALGGGALYAYYPLESLAGGRLIAVDVATGATRWDVVVPHGATGSAPELLVVGARRVYVPHWSWLDVIDASSGAVLGTIGN